MTIVPMPRSEGSDIREFLAADSEKGRLKEKIEKLLRGKRLPFLDKLRRSDREKLITAINNEIGFSLTHDLDKPKSKKV